MNFYANLVFVFCFFQCNLFTQTLKVGFGIGKPPYVFHESKTGIEIDLVKRIFSELKHDFKQRFFHFNYLQTSVIKGKVDIAVGVAIKNDGLYYSNGFTMYKNVAIAREKLDESKINFEKFIGLRVGGWKNASKNLGEEFKTAVDSKSFKYYEYPNQKNQNIAFWNNKLDIIIIDQTIFEWYRKTLNTSELKEIYTYPIFKEKYTYVSFKDKKIRDEFNRVLSELKKSGEYDRIVRSYSYKN